MYGERELPPFVWLYPTGRAGVDDCGVDPTGRLVVSAKALEVLQSMRIENCEISDLA